MKRSWFSAYHAFALLAVLHCLVAWVLAFANDFQTWWAIRLWVGLITLWPFWLVILLFHRGRRLLPAVVSITASILLLWPFLRWYDFMAGEKVFGWPRGLSIEPRTALAWTQAYLKGRADAKRDIQNSRLVIEEYGFGAGSGNRYKILRDRYGITLNATAQCLVDAKILGYADGYNSISEREIGRRYGPNTIKAAFDEGYRLDDEYWARQHQRERDLARTLSSLPSDDKLVLSWIKLFDDISLIDTDLPASEMTNVTNVVRWVESQLKSIVPADAPKSGIQISVELFANSPPQSSSWLLHDRRNNIPDIRSECSRLLVMIQFGDHNSP